MKTILILSIVFLVSFNIQSQTPLGVTFSYDLNGNRQDRVIIYSDEVIETIKEDGNSQESKTTKVHIQLIGKSNVSIYPNPTKGIILVEFTGIDKEMIGSISLTNQDGSVVFSQDKIKSRSKLDIRSKQNGIYFLTIILNDQKETWKIIKQ